MNDSTQINECLDISKDYYYFIRDMINDYSKYIKQYKLVNISINKKLNQFQEKFGQNLLDKEKLKNKYKNIDIDSLYEVTSIVPNIIQQLINNFNFVANGLDQIIDNLDEILNEKINIEKKEDDELEYESVKNNLNKCYKNIEKNKNTFFNKMSNIEDTIYKYHYKNYQNNSEEKVNTSHNKLLIIKDKSENLITKEQLNMVIKDGKKLESQYSASFDPVDDLLNSFNNISKKLKTNYSKLSLDLTKQLKSIIAEIAIILKNNFSEPLNETAMMLEKLNDFDKNVNLEKLIKDSFNINKIISKQKPKKYKIKIFMDAIKIKGNKNPKSHINYLEDGLDEMPYFEDYPSLYTVNTLYDSFDLIEKEYKLDLKIEIKKIQTKDITQKILSYIKKDKKEITDTGNILISQDEIKKLKELIDEHYNRVIFLQDLNTFRSKGLYGIPKDIFDFWNELFTIMANTIARDKDFHTAKNLIILSQTYFYKTNENYKYYMHEILKKNDIFRNYKFWEGYIQFSIENEIIKTIKNDKRNGTLIKKSQKESDDLYGRIVFAQLVSMADNMINFNFDMKKLKELIKPIIKHYNLNEESITIIDDIIHKNDLRKSILLNDEIKQFDINEIYKNFDVFGSINLINTNDTSNDDTNKIEKLEDIFNNPNDEEKNE